jgi:hypothetical protein
MSEINTLFLNATRDKFRFASPAGQVSVEDLWDLPLSGKGANLDDIAKSLYKQLKEADGEVSFVKPAVKSTAEIQAKFDIVKHVIDVKVAERDARAAAEERAATRRRIQELIAQKQDQDLAGKSIEELTTLLNSL